jgi:N-acetylmuramoyl-L-alanine amidase
MHEPVGRSRETQELIRRFQAERARRRRRRVVLASIGSAVLLALIVTAIVFAVPHPDQGGQSDPTTSTSRYPAGDSAGALATDTTLSDAGTTTISSTTSSSLSTTTISTTTTALVTRTFVVVIDPGHQAKANYDQEPIGPGSNTMKAKVSSGTKSVNTGLPESELVLTVSLKLRDVLVSHGIEVVMTRTTQDVDISNSERAQMANAAGADLFVRVHADGVNDSSVHGIHVLYPVPIAGWTDDIAVESKQAAQLALDRLIAATGARNLGLNARDDISGFNWSDVPVFLPEIGYMTNRTEDALLATPEYQDKIVAGLTQAILDYLGAS